MEETEKRKQTIYMILRASLICFICCLSAAWAVYGRILLESLGLKGWWIVFVLFIFLVIVSVCCCIRQKKWREIVTVAFFLGLAFFLPLEFKWQGLLAALCLGLALLMPAWRRLPKNSHRSLKPQEDEKIGRAHMYRKLWAHIFRKIAEQNMKPEPQRHGLCMAVTGEWGSGKTHFLSHTVYELDYMGKLKQDMTDRQPKRYPYTGAFSTASVDVLKATSEDEMWREIANALACAAGKDCSDRFLGHRIIRIIIQWFQRPLSLADEMAKILSMGGSEKEVVSSSLAAAIKEAERISMLVIDNIDRCRIDILQALFPAIESLSRIPNLVILCGVAKGNMTAIMGREAPGLCSALLKIFDDEIHIPLLSKRENQIFHRRLQVNKDTCFGKWFEKQEFYDVSPRLVKKIHDHLSALSQMYLERLQGHREDWDKDETNKSYDFEARCEAIFNFEALRIAFPNFPLPSRDWDPSKTGSETEKLIDNIEKPSDADAFQKWRDFIRKKYGSVIHTQKNPTRYGLFRIATNLSHSSTDSLNYLRDQEYTCLTSLTDDECELCLRDILHFSDILTEQEEERGAKEISRLIKGHVESEDMPYILQSLYDYCVSQSKLIKCMDFMKAFFEHGWHLKQAFFPLDYASALLRLNSPEEYNDYFCQRVLPSYRFDSLAYIANIILTCVQDEDAWNYDYSFNGREAAWGTRKMLQAFYKNWREPSYKAALDAVLVEYAKKACETILTYKGNMIHDYYKHLILGQSNHPESYQAALEEGTKQYLTSYGPKSTDFSQLLKAMTIVDATSGKPVPFVVLSFAVIWKVLFKELVNPEVLGEANKEKIRKLKELLEKMPPPKDELSEQFKANRETAMKIFKDCLK